MSIEQTLAEREKSYGSFSGHAIISQDLKKVMQKENGWKTLSVDQRESLEMIAHKIARILNGDPSYIDNWHDIAGYSTLIEERLTKDWEENEQY